MVLSRSDLQHLNRTAFRGESQVTLLDSGDPPLVSTLDWSSLDDAMAEGAEEGVAGPSVVGGGGLKRLLEDSPAPSIHSSPDRHHSVTRLLSARAESLESESDIPHRTTRLQTKEKTASEAKAPQRAALGALKTKRGRRK